MRNRADGSARVSMFTLESWTRIQRGLLSDPAYIGMTPGHTRCSVTLHWLSAADRTKHAQQAVEELTGAGIDVEHAVGEAPLGQVAIEADRLSELDLSDLQIHITSPNEDDTRVELTVALGSFADAAQRGTDVLVQMDPEVPVVIREGGRPYFWADAVQDIGAPIWDAGSGGAELLKDRDSLMSVWVADTLRAKHQEGIVAEAAERLKAADLIPPVGDVESVSTLEVETVLTAVRGPIGPGVAHRVAKAMGSLPYKLREVPPHYGLTYRQRGDYGVSAKPSVAEACHPGPNVKELARHV